jgi:hypothetical protein
VKELERADLHLEHVSRRLAAVHCVVQDNLPQQAEVRLMAGQRQQDEICVEAVEAVLRVWIAALKLLQTHVL